MRNSHFLFAGTAKAGTTSIYEYLNQHPQVHIPVKETFYFLKEVYTDFSLGYPAQRAEEDLILNEADYRKLYPEDPEKIHGEIGTGYLYHHRTSIPLIQKTLGKDVKILIILRNPVQRAYSSYMHFVKDVHERLSFEDSLKKEEERKKLKYDFMWFHRDLGLYADQVEAFLKAFNQVKILITEEFADNPEEGMKDIFEFLEIDPDVKLNFEKVYNKSGQPKSKGLQRLITQENVIKKTLRPAFRKLYSKEKREKIRKRVKNMNISGYRSMDPKIEAKLKDFYQEDVRKLEKLIGRPLVKWGFDE